MKKGIIAIHSFPLGKNDIWLGRLYKVVDVPVDENGKPSKNMGVCTRHWPANYKTKRRKGHDIPVDPPSIFDSPASIYPQITPSMARKKSENSIQSQERNLVKP